MGVRVDQLLQWLCLAKSRSLAARACREGHVLVNGERVRPSREPREGERLTLIDPVRGRHRELELLCLPERQASRKAAPEHYRWVGEGEDGARA